MTRYHVNLTPVDFEDSGKLTPDALRTLRTCGRLMRGDLTTMLARGFAAEYTTALKAMERGPLVGTLEARHTGMLVMAGHSRIATHGMRAARTALEALRGYLGLPTRRSGLERDKPLYEAERVLCELLGFARYAGARRPTQVAAEYSENVELGVGSTAMGLYYVALRIGAALPSGSSDRDSAPRARSGVQPHQLLEAHVCGQGARTAVARAVQAWGPLVLEGASSALHNVRGEQLAGGTYTEAGTLTGAAYVTWLEDGQRRDTAHPIEGKWQRMRDLERQGWAP